MLHGHPFRCHVAVEARSNVDENFARESPLLKMTSAAQGNAGVRTLAGLIVGAGRHS
jgi:hypothetical protein